MEAEDVLLASIARGLFKAGADPVDYTVTFFVGGLIISGRLISRETYLKGIALEPLFSGLGEALSRFKASQEEQKNQYYHLKDVTIVRPSIPDPQITHKFTRLRAASIDGYLLGE